MRTIKASLSLAALAMSAALVGCSGELTDNAAPVELVVTTSQKLQILDLNPSTANTDPDCAQSIGTIQMRVLPKRTDLTTVASQVRVTRYRVSYQRTDGGKLVPAPFVRSIDALIGVGDTADLTNLLIVQPDAVTQAPFASLLPQNGGRDPDTGRPFVKMDVIVEIFGATLGGDRVYDATRFPLDFCYGCGGCS